MRYFFVFLLIILLCQAIYSEETSPSEYRFVKKEGEIVRLFPEASDIDNDTVIFTFSTPLNNSGEWQTNYDNSGEYPIIITAFDGKTTTEQKAIVVIENVNRPPIITVDNFTISEMEPTFFLPDIRDPDGDNITFTLSSPFNSSFEWTPTFNDSGEYSVTIAASDGQLDTTKTITLGVTNTNQPPVLTFEPVDDVAINETEFASFHVGGTDPDGDNISYQWFVDDNKLGDGEDFTYVSDYSSSGEHDIRCEATDGDAVAANGWIVRVGNVNRPPVLNFSSTITIYENQTLDLNLQSTDADGTPLVYVVTDPVDAQGLWTATFSDSGTYNITVTVSDGELSVTRELALTVLDVDRAPTFAPIAPATIREDDYLRMRLNVSDPDGDDITFYGDGLPNGAAFEDFVLTWHPGYDFVVAPRGLFSLLLGFFGYHRVASLRVTGMVAACGKERCTNQTIELSVTNINQAPVLEALPKIIVNETGTAVFDPAALDPDGDRVSFYFGAPFNKRGRWITNYSDAGIYSVLVGASDGIESSEKLVDVTVWDVNRIPLFGSIPAQRARENETISFNVQVFDPDEDDVLLWADEMPSDALFNEGIFSWTPGYNAVNGSGTKEFTVTFAASSDQENTVKMIVPITVVNSNRAAVITLLEPALATNTTIGQPVTFKAEAFDPDGDALHYSWKFGIFDSLSAPAVRRTFTTPGIKTVQLIVDDGDAESYATFSINVRGTIRTQPVRAVQPVQPRPTLTQTQPVVVQPRPAAPQPTTPEPTFVTFTTD